MITVTAAISESLIREVERREQEWADAENATDLEKELQPDREIECMRQTDLAYASVGHEVMKQYWASLAGCRPRNALGSFRAAAIRDPLSDL